MKHAKNRPPWYLYVVGAAMWTGRMLLKCGKRLWEHINEFIMTLSFVGMIAAVQAFDDGVISYTTSILFVTILILLVMTVIKVKILENTEKNR